MTKTRKFEVVLPDGSIGKRSSKTKVYAYAVVARVSYEYELRVAQTVTPGQFEITVRNFDEYVARVNGTSDCTSPARLAEAREEIEGCANAQEYSDKIVRKAVAKVEAKKARGYYDEWFALSWSSRYDLAVKAMNSAGPFYVGTAVLPAREV